MAARPNIAKARKTTNFIESYSCCYRVDGHGPFANRYAAASRRHMAGCLTKGRMTGLTPSLNLSGDFLEMDEARKSRPLWRLRNTDGHRNVARPPARLP